MFSHKSDFVAIGDIVIDAFIRLKDAHIITNEHGHKEIAMDYGVKIPFEFAEIVPAVGNSANAAVSAARLGLSSSLIAHVGADKNGEECIAHLKKDKVGTHYISSHKHLTTNYHYVLWYKDDRTILIKHEVFPYALPSHLEEPTWMYLSSLGDTSTEFHHEIARYLKEHPNVKLVFQPGTFQIKLGKDVLKEIYARTNIFFCNVEEAQQILNTESRHLPTLLHEMKKLGPELPVITDGPDGSYTLMNDKAIYLEAYPDPKPPYERTGAGDAFASTFAVAIAKGKSEEDALKWASINSMSVCQCIGAQKGLLSEGGLLDWLARAPKDWGIKYLE